MRRRGAAGACEMRRVVRARRAGSGGVPSGVAESVFGTEIGTVAARSAKTTRSGTEERGPPALPRVTRTPRTPLAATARTRSSDSVRSPGQRAWTPECDTSSGLLASASTSRITASDECAVSTIIPLVSAAATAAAPQGVRPPRSTPWAEPPAALSAKWCRPSSRKPASNLDGHNEAAEHSVRRHAAAACACVRARECMCADAKAMRNAGADAGCAGGRVPRTAHPGWPARPPSRAPPPRPATSHTWAHTRTHTHESARATQSPNCQHSTQSDNPRPPAR
jgi:hypothetical protein